MFLDISQQAAIKFHLNQAKVLPELEYGDSLTFDYSSQEMYYLGVAIYNCDVAFENTSQTSVVLQLVSQVLVAQDTTTTTVIVKPLITTTQTNEYGDRQTKTYQRLAYTRTISIYYEACRVLARTLGVQLG
jgi:hypothetical protein